MAISYWGSRGLSFQAQDWAQLAELAMGGPMCHHHETRSRGAAGSWSKQFAASGVFGGPGWNGSRIDKQKSSQILLGPQNSSQMVTVLGALACQVTYGSLANTVLWP